MVNQSDIGKPIWTSIIGNVEYIGILEEINNTICSTSNYKNYVYSSYSSEEEAKKHAREYCSVQIIEYLEKIRNLS